MTRRKNDHPVSDPDGSILPETQGPPENEEEELEDDESSGMGDPGEWTILQTGDPAADVIASYIFEAPWDRTENGRDGKRQPTAAVEIKEREGGSPTGKEVSVFAHNVKQDGPDLAGQLDKFFADRFQLGEPEPVRYIWAVMRSSLPELRNFDSRRTFHVVNRAWAAQRGGGGFLPAVPGTSGIMRPGGGLGAMPGMAPVSIFNGPSPLGLEPSRFNAPPFVQQASSGIHGDIGGTGMRDLVYAMVDAFGRMSGTMEKNQLFYADLIARQSQVSMSLMEQVGRVLLRHPDAEMERYRLEHEFKMRQFDGQGELELEKRRETSGMVKDLGGKLLENPGLTATLMGVARKLGVTKEDVVAAIGGDEE